MGLAITGALAPLAHRDVTTLSQLYRMEILDSHSWNSTTNIGGGNGGTVGSDSYRYYLSSNNGAAITFDNGEFTNTNFTYATLVGTDIHNINENGANFTGADLTGAATPSRSGWRPPR